jgi:hypothetical protein
MRDGRVLSRIRPETPSFMKRSCQRQTAVLLVSVRRMISAVPQPSAVSRTICARQTCFCGLFRSTTIAARRWRSSVFNSTVTPVRMRQTRTHRDAGESQIGLDCQFLSTRNFDWAWFNSRLDKLSRMMAIRFGQDYAVNS